MANLADIAMVDGLLAGAEGALLEAYVDYFNLHPDQARTIIDIMAMKNDEEAFD